MAHLSSDQKADWQSILDLSQSICNLTELQDWDGLDELLVLQQTKLETFFGQLKSISEDDSTRIKTDVRQILATNVAVMNKCRERKTEVRSALKSIADNRKAAKGYGAV